MLLGVAAIFSAPLLWHTLSRYLCYNALCLDKMFTYIGRLLEKSQQICISLSKKKKKIFIRHSLAVTSFYLNAGIKVSFKLAFEDFEKVLKR